LFGGTKLIKNVATGLHKHVFWDRYFHDGFDFIARVLVSLDVNSDRCAYLKGHI